METVDKTGRGISVDYQRQVQHYLATGKEQAWQQSVLDASWLLEHEVDHVPDYYGVERKESAYTPVDQYVLLLLSRWKNNKPRMESLNCNYLFTGMVRIIYYQFLHYAKDCARELAAPCLHPVLFCFVMEEGLVENNAGPGWEGPVIGPMDFENLGFEDVVDPCPMSFDVSGPGPAPRPTRRDSLGPGPAPRSPWRVLRPLSLSPPPDIGEPLEWAMVWPYSPPKRACALCKHQ